MGAAQAEAQRIGVLPALQVLQTRKGRLGYMVSGAAAPAILLFNGAGVGLQGWQALYPAIADCGTVFGWNRFGLEGSDAPGARQTGTVVVASLRELLRHAGIAPPYVLVAHSFGGLYANLYARLHPREVAGVLLLEATHPDDHDALRENEEHMVKALGRLQDLPEARLRANVRAELAAAEEIAREIDAAGPFPEVPLRVLTGGLTPRAAQVTPVASGARRAHQDELARLSPLGEQIIAQASGHFPQMTQPELVLEVLRGLLRQVRAES